MECPGHPVLSRLPGRNHPDQRYYCPDCGHWWFSHNLHSDTVTPCPTCRIKAANSKQPAFAEGD